MNFLIYIIINTVLAYVIAKDAEARGMDPIGCGLLTFLFNIFAIIPYLITRKPLIKEY